MMSHACHAICTLSPLHAINTQRNSSEVLRLPPKCCACHEKCNSSSEKKKTQKYCACHTKRLSTLYRTRENTMPAAQNDITTSWETFENERFCFLSVCLPACLSVWLAGLLCVCLWVSLFVCMFVCLLVCM